MALDRALGLNFTLEFTEANSAIVIVVELLQHLGSFLGSHVETTAFNNPLDFVSVDLTISVHVKRVEGLESVEVGAASKALSDTFSSELDLEVNAPHVTELDLSVSKEAVVTAMARLTVVGGTTVQHVCVV